MSDVICISGISMIPPAPGDKFQHLNGRVYQVECLARDEDRQEILVIHSGPDGAMWSRTIGDFMGLKDGVPRFSRIIE